MTPGPGLGPLAPPAVRWVPGVVAFAVAVVTVVVVAVVVGLAADDRARVAVLVAAPVLALLGAAVGVLLARRAPDARAVAVGLVWAAPVCAVVATVAVLSG